MKWISILMLITCPSLWAQTGAVVIKYGGQSVPIDSVVIHVPGGGDIMVSEEVNRLLAEQAANWMAELDSTEAAYSARLDSVEGELAQVLAGQDGQLMGMQDTILALKQSIADQWAMIAEQEAAIDSMDQGWNESFTTGKAIIAEQDSLLNLYADQAIHWAEVAAAATAQRDTVVQTIHTGLADSSAVKLLIGIGQLLTAWDERGAAHAEAGTLSVHINHLIALWEEQ